MEDNGALKNRIERHQQKIFALVLYLIGGDQDKAYDIATSSFAAVIRGTSINMEERTFLVQLVSMAIKKSKDVKTVPSFDDGSFADFPFAKRRALFLVRRALQLLSFQARVLLLLRDQLHFLYKDIADVLHISESEVRAATIRAQEQFREKVEEVLNNSG